MNEQSHKGLGWIVLAATIALFIIFLVFKTITVKESLNPAIATPIPQPEPIKKLETSESKMATNPDLINGLANTYNVFGSQTPLITIVEFGDFTCPYCAASHKAIRMISTKYQNQVRFIYRDRTPSDRSLGLALSAHCAGEQGKFWELHDLLFSNQSDTLGDNPQDPELVSLFNKAGLNLKTLSDCIKSGHNFSKVQKNVADSERLDVKGTPTWFINGEKFEGVISVETLENYITQLLLELSKNKQ